MFHPALNDRTREQIALRVAMARLKQRAMALPTQLSNTTEQHLQSLIDAEVREGKAIEYKRELSIKEPDAKRKFIRTVASFANAAGGEIVFGVEADNGVPTKLVPLVAFDPDATVMTVRDILRAHVDPPLFGIEYQPVQISGGWALVIRVSRSWQPPHMVKHDEDRFFTRDANGCVRMNVAEIRNAVLMGEAIKQRIQRYRFERLSAIRAGELPFKLPSHALSVLHILPFRSVADANEGDFAASAENELEPFGRWSGMSRVYDVDGMYAVEGSRVEGASYTFVSRSGCLEVVTPLGLTCHNRKLIANPGLELQFTQHTPVWLELLTKHGAEPPFCVALTLLDVRDYILYSGPMSSLAISGARPLRHRDLDLPMIVLQSLDDMPKAFKPMWDALWRASGLSRSFNFDEHGNWKPRDWH